MPSRYAAYACDGAKIRHAIQAATGLSEDQIDRVAEGLVSIGVGLVLPNGADIRGAQRVKLFTPCGVFG